MRDLGRLQIKVNKREDAHRSLANSLAGDARPFGSHYWLGRLAEAEGQLEAAVQEYERELEDHPFAENARRRLLPLLGQLGRDASAFTEKSAAARAAPVAEFLPDKPGEPLALFTGIDASWEGTFQQAETADILVNVSAWSTPFDGVYGWVEVLLDGRHIQTLYVAPDPLEPDTSRAQTFHIRLNEVEPGPHTLRILNLSDGMDEKADRNTLFHRIRIHRLK
jgi:hypothetical protein